MATATNDRPIDIEAAAEYLGVEVRFVRRLCQERRVRFLRLGGKVRFLPTDLDDFLEAAAVSPEHRTAARSDVDTPGRIRQPPTGNL